jgi:hypothetical protein
VRVQAEGQEKALRKQKNQGQRASQENAARTATQTSQPTVADYVRECPLVLGPTTHDVRRKGAL